MPRRTHPRPRPKHSRAHVSHQRDRYIARRWRLAEDLYNDDFWLAEKIHEPGPVGSDKRRLLHLFRQVGPVLFMHPEVIRRLPRRLRERSPWPFSLPRGDYARNPFTRCSCLDCTNWKRLDPSRAREKRQWRRVEQTVARMGDLNRSLHHPLTSRILPSGSSAVERRPWAEARSALGAGLLEAVDQRGRVECQPKLPELRAVEPT